MRIGLDLMGGDHPPHRFWDLVAAHIAKARGKGYTLVVLGLADVLSTLRLDDVPYIECVPVEEEISMEDPPLMAARSKGASSLAIGLKMVAAQKLDAFITGGNSGALIASALRYLSKIPGILRPAFLALLPTKDQPVAVLDVGANLSCKPDHLLQYARMGAVYQQMRGISHPKVGLLNIGTEEGKGTLLQQQAYASLRAYSAKSSISFVGNVEGRDVFRGAVDVLVTDGFTGNIFLKTAEGMAAFALEQIAATAPPAILADLQGSLDYGEYPGALLSGVEGVVIKCHGSSTVNAYLNAIESARVLVQKQIIHYFSREFC